MGQKTHPRGFRLGIVAPWKSRWYAERDFPKLLAEAVNEVGLQLHLRQQHRPCLGGGDQVFGLLRRFQAGLDRAAVGVVAFEVRRVDDDLLHAPERAEFQHRPVVARFAAAARLPAVTHVHAAPWGGQVAHRAIVLVVGDDPPPAVGHGQQVDGLFGAVSAAAARGEEVSIPGFGKFKVQAKPARTGRNPATGGTIQIAASKKVSFTPAKQLKDAVNK